MRNLISEAISPAGHFWQCRCKFSGKGVSQRCWNQFGYLFHTWFARVLSAGKPQSAFHRVFHGFMEWVVEIFYSTEMGFDLLHFLWPAPLSLTCSTFCLACTGGKLSVWSQCVCLWWFPVWLYTPLELDLRNTTETTGVFVFERQHVNALCKFSV